MVDRRIPARPKPAPYPRTVANHRIVPRPILPPISQLYFPPVQQPYGQLSYGQFIPSTPAPQSASNLPALSLHAHDAASLRAAGSTSNVPAVTIGSRALLNGADREVGNVEFDHPWVKSHIVDLEVFARHESGEVKGKVYLGIWLIIRKAGLQGMQSARLFIKKSLMPYPWFKGDETITEALRVFQRLEFTNAGLLARKYTANANWFWDKKIGNVSVRDYWAAEGMKLRQKIEAQKQEQEQEQEQEEGEDDEDEDEEQAQAQCD